VFISANSLSTSRRQGFPYRSDLPIDCACSSHRDKLSLKNRHGHLLCGYLEWLWKDAQARPLKRLLVFGYISETLFCTVGIDMANSWNIPKWLEKEIRERDKVCVYCGKAFTATKASRKSSSSWEHIINDAKLVTRKILLFAVVVAMQAKGKKTICLA